MTLQQLKYIVTVAECGNITEAAEKLFIAQPSITSAIHNIEEEMGITAFIRSNKGESLQGTEKHCFHMHVRFWSRRTL